MISHLTKLILRNPKKESVGVKVHTGSAKLLVLSTAVLRSLLQMCKQSKVFSAWIDEEVTITIFHDNLIAVILRIYF